MSWKAQTIRCSLFGHVLPPWPHPWRKWDERGCLRKGCNLGEWRGHWLTNEDRAMTKPIRKRF